MGRAGGNGRRGRTGKVLIGTSGWAYPHWRRGVFFPPKLPQRQELPYIAGRFSTVEVNGTFYSLTRPSACESWREAVPEGFVFAIKGSRYITHMLKLAKFEAPLANFFASGILRLGKKLGPLLWQLPPNLGFNADRARAFFEAVPRDIPDAERWARRHDSRLDGRAALRAPDGRTRKLRHAVEPRHASWMEEPALRLLEELDIAMVAADTAGKHPFSLARTAGFAYLRLHGSTVLYASRYTDEEIATWAGRIRRLRDEGIDVYAYFDNDAKAHAPYDAARLDEAVSGRRLPAAGALEVSAAPPGP